MYREFRANCEDPTPPPASSAAPAAVAASIKKSDAQENLKGKTKKVN